VAEHEEQALLVATARARWPEYVIASVPNGVPLLGMSTRVRATLINYLKAEGLLPGMPDLLVFAPKMTPPDANGVSIIWHGCAIEMKRQDGGRLSREQKQILAQLEQAGYYTVVAHGYPDAIETLEIYMNWYDPPQQVRVALAGAQWTA
jgi:hypothetical protein